MNGMTWELLERYLAHQCAGAEREMVERWLKEESFRSLTTNSLDDATSTANVVDRGAKARLYLHLEATAGLTSRPGSIRFRLFDLALVAAVMTGVVLAGGRLYLWSARGTPTTAPERVATTPAGQRATLRLADGTRVMLGVATTLRSLAEPGDGPRTVELSGEAYFEVAPGDRRPFVVRAADLVARDIGTAFLVRAYPDEPHARIVVREGSVAVRGVLDPDTARVSLIAQGQVGRLVADGELIVEAADTTAYFSWLEGRLTIDNIPLRAALPQLSRWYNLDFRLADSVLGDVPLTATLGSRLTPDVLDLLARSLGMRQERVGRTVTFYPATGFH